MQPPRKVTLENCCNFYSQYNTQPLRSLDYYARAAYRAIQNSSVITFQEILAAQFENFSYSLSYISRLYGDEFHELIERDVP